MVNYSSNFQVLLSDQKRTLTLLEECHFHADDFKHWEEQRLFIAQAINQSGSILDIGCANGFLLKCLNEWQTHKLIPYGIDTDPQHIVQAKEMFPEFSDNFAVLSIENLEELQKLGLPEKYNTVYWNVWDNRKFTQPGELVVLKSVMGIVKLGGRLILGFYDGEKQNNLERVAKLKTLGFEPSGILENPDGVQAICWFDVQ